MYKLMTLFDNHTAKFSTRSLELVCAVPPTLDSENCIRARCMEFLQLHSEPVLIDAGANIGQHSVLATLHPKMQVIAFEPYPVALECLYENMVLNGIADRIQIEPYGLSNQEGTALLVVPATNKKGKQGHIGWARIMPPGIIPPWGGTQTIVEIPLRTLDSFNIPKIHVLKIDVEGHQYPLVLGACNTIQRCRPIIEVETRGHIDPKNARDIDLLISWGYEIFEILHQDVWLRPKG